MFHKYENYIDDLIINSEILISELNNSSISLSKYSEQKFNYKIKDWKNSPMISRLNWISICNKHYDGFPRKEPKDPAYINLPENERMKFTKDDFIRDIDMLIQYYTLMLQAVFNIALYKMTFELEENNSEINIQNPEILEKKQKTEEIMIKFIGMMKTL